MLMTFLTIEAIGALLLFLVCAGLYAARRNEERATAIAIGAAETRETEKEARRSELLERLSDAYKKAKKRGVHNFYLLAVSHCCQLLRNGEEINEGAALLALRGLEGDESLNATVEEILTERCKNEGSGK